MRFYQYQQQARRWSRRLLWLYLPAVTVVVGLTTWWLLLLLPGARLPEQPAWLCGRSAAFAGWTLFAVLGLVLGGSVYKWAKLSRGGHVVAEELGGQRVFVHTAEPQHRQLLNVVEEMAIAAGLPLPRVYVLPEHGINALAAGLHRRAAVIAVTEGALQALSRDELQAVVAHEFSHILHGDMRLNMRLSALLHGLMMIGMAGQWLLFGGPRPLAVREDDGSWPAYARRLLSMAGPVFALLGLALVLLGLAGTVLAGWIQAAVSRQREFLADASAVQFTRRSSGLFGALHKIATRPARHWRAWQAGEYAHFMFVPVNEDDWLTRLAATHPPLLVRLHRLNPAAAARLAPVLPSARRRGAGVWLAGDADGADANHRAGTPYWLQPLGGGPAQGAQPDMAGLSPGERMLEEVMRIHPEHMAYAAWLRQSLPPAWYAASQDPQQAPALVCALLLSADADAAARQQAWLAAQGRYDLAVAALWARRHGFQAAHALPLVDLSLPALASLPAAERQNWLAALPALLQAGGTVSLHQWCVWTVLCAHLQPMPASPLPWDAAADALAQVLAWAAQIKQTPDAAAAAYARAAADWGLPERMPERSLRALQAAVQRLAGLGEAHKANVLQAALTAIRADGRVDVAERELMRAVAACLRYPMPPLLPAAA